MDPLAQFEGWFADAREQGASMPHAVALATVGSDNRPSVRMVLYKGLSEGGLNFFTNYESRKARELASNAHAAMVFHWRETQRQVRIEGAVQRLSEEESDAYFASRSRASRLSAWASAQSSPYGERREILERYAEIEARFAGSDVPRPAFWGGFGLVPDRMEFWTEMPNRFHDREEYRLDDGVWHRRLLQP